MLILAQLTLCSIALGFAVVLFRRARGGESAGSRSPPLVKDPRALAWLRGGEFALVELTLYDLARRGLLAEAECRCGREPHFVLASAAAAKDRLDPLEVAILLACERPCPRGRIYGAPSVRARAAEDGAILRDELSRLGLAVSAAQNGHRLALAGHALPWLAFATAAVLLRALPAASDLEIRPAGALFVLTMTGLVALSLPVRTTVAGERALAHLEREHSAERLRLLGGVGRDADLLRLRALFGMEVSLGVAEEPDAQRLRGRSFVRR